MDSIYCLLELQVLILLSFPPSIMFIVLILILGIFIPTFIYGLFLLSHRIFRVLNAFVFDHFFYLSSNIARLVFQNQSLPPPELLVKIKLLDLPTPQPTPLLLSLPKDIKLVLCLLTHNDGGKFEEDDEL